MPYMRRPLTLSVDPGAEMDEENRWMVERKPVTLIISKNVWKDVSAEWECRLVAAFDVTAKMDSTSTNKNDRNMQGRWNVGNTMWEAFQMVWKVTIEGGNYWIWMSMQVTFLSFSLVIIPSPEVWKERQFTKDYVADQRRLILCGLMFGHMQKNGNSMWLVQWVPLWMNDDNYEEEGRYPALYADWRGETQNESAAPDIPFHDAHLNNARWGYDDLSRCAWISQGVYAAGLIRIAV